MVTKTSLQNDILAFVAFNEPKFDTRSLVNHLELNIENEDLEDSTLEDLSDLLNFNYNISKSYLTVLLEKLKTEDQKAPVFEAAKEYMKKSSFLSEDNLPNNIFFFNNYTPYRAYIVLLLYYFKDSRSETKTLDLDLATFVDFLSNQFSNELTNSYESLIKVLEKAFNRNIIPFKDRKDKQTIGVQ